MKISAIILAGGLGTRLRSAIPDLPKPMAPVNGYPFLQHQMDYWIAQGVNKFILSVGYRWSAIADYFGKCYRGIPLVYVVEDQPLGTGGGLLLSLEYLSDANPVLVLNGDTFFELSLEKLALFHSDRNSDWTFSLFQTCDTTRYMGMGVEFDGRINSLKARATQESQLANGGVYMVMPDVVKELNFTPGSKLSLEEDIFSKMLDEGSRLFGIDFEGRFIDIGIPSDYHRASSILAKNGGNNA